MRKVDPRTVSKVAGLLLVFLSGCGWDGHFSILGYTTRPNYDTSIKTVYVPIFQNATMRANVNRTLEFDLTRAVIQEIESKTPYKVVDSPGGADTELLGKIVRVNKTVINQNQLGEVRDSQVIIAAEIVWRDLRAGHLGELLSSKAGASGGADLPQGIPGSFGGPAAISKGATLVTSMGTFQPELGGSISSAEQVAYQNMAVQIISMMEIWRVPAPPPPPIPPPGP